MASINLRCKLGESLTDCTDPRRVDEDSAYKLKVLLLLLGDVPKTPPLGSLDIVIFVL